MLSEKQQLAYRLYKRDGKTQGQIASLLGTRRESVNRLIARAENRIDVLRRTCVSRGSGCELLESILN